MANSTETDPLISRFFDLVRNEDVSSIIECQKSMLTRFEKTNEMLVNCNALAVIRFENASRDLRKFTQQLIDIQKDLDSVFHRIRFLRLKLSQQYPNAFSACSNVFNVFDEEEETNEEIKANQKESQYLDKNIH